MQPGNKKKWKEIGPSLDDWKAFNADEISEQWQVKSDVLVFTPAEGERQGTETLITRETFTNFELSLEWKISEGGNSGIMWGVKEGKEYDEPHLTGPEIQILDNARHPDAHIGETRQAGALYDMVPPKEDVTRPAGQWNELIIKINYNENRGTVTMNGTKINAFPLQGQEWENLKQNSKFSGWQDFGKYKSGHIALQDHGDKVSYRKIKVRTLD